MLKKHPEVILILLILLTSFIVTMIIVLTKDNKTEEIKYKYDTDMFVNVSVKGAIQLFDQKEPAILFIGRQNCEGCSYQGPYLEMAIALYHVTVNHLDLDTIDFSDESINVLANKLDYPYELYDVEGPFGMFIGYTPMLIIIKNGKQVYGNIGPLTEEEIKVLIEKYGVIHEES